MLVGMLTVEGEGTTRRDAGRNAAAIGNQWLRDHGSRVWSCDVIHEQWHELPAQQGWRYVFEVEVWFV